MKSHYLNNKIGRILLALSFMAGVGLVSSVAVQAQRPWDRDQDSQTIALLPEWPRQLRRIQWQQLSVSAGLPERFPTWL